MSRALVQRVYEMLDLPPTERVVLAVIAGHVNHKRWVETGVAIAWPSTARLAKYACTSERTVERALERLQKRYQRIRRRQPKRRGFHGVIEYEFIGVEPLADTDNLSEKSDNLSGVPTICRFSSDNLSTEPMEGNRRNEPEEGTGAAAPRRTLPKAMKAKLTTAERADKAEKNYRRQVAQ